MTGSEQVLIEDWCQQYPSHSVGSVEFGRDGALYASGGDGASFNFVDWGQDGSPLNPCGDPPGGVGATLTPPTAEGGALRSQDLRTLERSGRTRRHRHPGRSSHGCALPDNPAAGATDPTTGASSPPASATRSGSPTGQEPTRSGSVTSAGTTGKRSIASTDAARVENFGWPCYEGREPAVRIRRRESEHLREPVRAVRGGHGALLRLPPHRPRGAERDLPHRKLLDCGPGVRVRCRPELLPGRVRRRAVLRRLLPRLHLGHAEGCRRTTRPRADPHLRRRCGQSRQPRDRAWRRPVLRRLRRRHDPAHHLRQRQPDLPLPSPTATPDHRRRAAHRHLRRQRLQRP